MSDITSMMPSLHVLSRLGALRSGLPRLSQRTTLSDLSSLRVEVCPPSLRTAPNSAWQRALFWLLAPAPQDASPPPNRLDIVRQEFLAALSDIHNEAARNLRDRITLTRSLRELWHVRADVYSVVGVAHTQAEAEVRVALLNRHFPTRAPRSQFAPL